MSEQSSISNVIPLRNEKTRFHCVDNDVLVFQTELKQYHVLNSVAAHIWELCDGKNTVEAISSRLADHYDTGGEAIGQDTIDTICGFKHLSLVTFV